MNNTYESILDKVKYGIQVQSANSQLDHLNRLKWIQICFLIYDIKFLSIIFCFASEHVYALYVFDDTHRINQHRNRVFQLSRIKLISCC